MLHLGVILLKKSSPALPADTAQPQLALRTAVTQHKNAMFHTSPATWNVRLSVAEGSSRTRPAEPVGGGCWGAADQGTTGHSDALSSSGNVVTHHGWAGTKSQMAGKEGE